MSVKPLLLRKGAWLRAHSAKRLENAKRIAFSAELLENAGRRAQSAKREKMSSKRIGDLFVILIECSMFVFFVLCDFLFLFVRFALCAQRFAIYAMRFAYHLSLADSTLTPPVRKST
jgi:hypothetical protein